MDLHVFRNETDTVIATSAEDATAVVLETSGQTENSEPETWEQLADDKPLTIDFSEEGLGERTMTCAEWCKDQGRSFLASTEA